QSWTVADGHTGLVIEARTYSDPGDTVWLDDFQVTCPDTATVVMISGGGAPVIPEPAGLGLIGLAMIALGTKRR
ncbi:MAG: PEP-CTERM sorting domain-containing protein, partial [Planctomycetota bacterium]